MLWGADHMLKNRETAERLAVAYGKLIEAEHALLDAGLSSLSRDLRETRNLTWAELLGLYINTSEQTVRNYLHTLGIGDRLLEDARLILRFEGDRRRLETMEADRQQFTEGAQPYLRQRVCDPVPEVGGVGLQLLGRSPARDAELVG